MAQVKKLNNSTNIWKSIEKQHDMNKRTFGKKINFIKDSATRKAIFRDVEHCFLLLNRGFDKPAIILAGGLIEEILRQYLIVKNIKPEKDTFDSYIKKCSSSVLIGKALTNLSDAVRDFRNYVHIKKELNSKDKISKSLAQSAVSSLFVIVQGLQIKNKKK